MRSFADLKTSWKITAVAGVVFLPAMAAGTLYFYERVYDLQVQTALDGLMNLALKWSTSGVPAMVCASRGFLS